MAYLSELIGKPVTDVEGERIGSLKDLVAGFRHDLSHPVIEALVISQKGGEIITPFSSAAVLFSAAIPLIKHLNELPDFKPAENDFYLARDVLDKQIIDTEGARVVRVNDVELLRVNGPILVSNVDVSTLAVLRRVGLEKFAINLSRLLHVKLARSSISLEDVELLHHDQSMRLRVPSDKLKELHPADMAEIISDLNRLESEQILENMDVEHVANALEEVEPDFQASLVETMPDEKVADVLEEMAPDEAADLLAELPKERSEDLLELMQKEDADDVRKLMAFPIDAAGGLMTTEYASVRDNMTVRQAIEALRKTANEAETIFYVYVVDEKNHLVGVFSLSKLIFADPKAKVTEIMYKRVVSTKLLDPQPDIARAIAKYDLLAVPVVDDDNVMQGIVTSDDALDKIIPTAWKKRLPRFYR